MEALDLNASLRNAIDFAYNSVFVKIFNIKEKQTISLCQYYTANLPASYRLDSKAINFIQSFSKLSGCLPFVIDKLTSSDDTSKIYKRYSTTNGDLNHLSNSVKKLFFHNWFEKSIAHLI
jgi:hypothetical protein